MKDGRAKTGNAILYGNNFAFCTVGSGQRRRKCDMLILSVKNR